MTDHINISLQLDAFSKDKRHVTISIKDLITGENIPVEEFLPFMIFGAEIAGANDLETINGISVKNIENPDTPPSNRGCNLYRLSPKTL